MANYNVDIALYVKGGVELDKLNKKLKQTQELQEKIEKLSNGASSANYLRNKLEAEKDFAKFKQETLKANKKITDQEQKLFEITQKRGRAEREFGEEGNRLARQKTAEFLKQQRLLLQMSRQYSEPIGPVASGATEFRRDKARRQRAQFIASGAPGVPVAGAQQALPAFRERGLQILDNSVKLNESQLRIEAALNGERQRGVRFLEAQSREEKRQLDLGIAGQRSNLIPGVSSGKAVPTTQFPRPIGPQPARAGGAGRAGGGGKGLSNLALGVGFPLLFGGGAGSVAGGALGSVGGMGGQVLGSAIGGIIDQTVESIAELGQALNPFTADIKAVTSAAGESGTAFERLVVELEEVAGKEKALEVATAQLATVIGQGGVEALEKFGADATDLGNATSEALSQTAAAVADLINVAGILKGLTAGIERGNLLGVSQTSSDPEIKKLREQLSRTSPGSSKEGTNDARKAIEDRIVARQKELQVEEQLGIAKQAQADIQAKIDEKTSSSIFLKEQELVIAQNGGDVLNEQVQTALQNVDAEKIRLKILEAQGDQLKINLAFKEGQLLAAIRTAKIEAATDAKEAKDRRKAEAAGRKLQRELEAREKGKAAAEAALGQSSIDLMRADLERTALLNGEEAALNQRLAVIGQERDIKMEILRVQYLQRDSQAKSLEEQQALYDAYLNQYEILKITAEVQYRKTEDLQEQLALAEQISALSAAAGFDVLGLAGNTNAVQDRGIYAPDTGPVSFEEGIDLAPLIAYQVELDKILEKYPLIGEAADAAAGLITTGFASIIDGTKSAEEVFADFLNNIADMLLKTAQQMIAQYIAIGIAKMFAGFGSSFSGSSFSDFSGSITGGNPFAAGGKLDFFPTVPQFADGGRPPVGRPSIVGERGPELFVPGASGTIIPNEAMGGTSVVVNVDASGSKAEGDTQNAKQLGSLIGAAVQAELVKQQRPGGILAS